jgi:imidazolonepropionase-like amidohydrolase
LGNVIDLVEDKKNFTRESVEKQLKTYASYGVTSVLSMGVDQDLIFQIRAEQRAGRPGMARVFTAGQGFKGKGGYPDAPGLEGVPYEVTTPQEVERALSALAEKRVDIVKVWVDDHLGTLPKISPALRQAIIAGAHKHGLKVAAHLFYLEDARQLVAAGLDALAHSVRDAPVDDALIAAMKQHGTWQIPTLSREAALYVYAKPHPFLDDPFFTQSVSAGLLNLLKTTYRKQVAADPNLAKYPVWFDTAKQNLKRLADAGVKIGFGTDTGPVGRFPGYFEHWEMEFMTDAGLTPQQTITAATRSSAEFLGAKDLGTLEAGKWADLIVLNRNPLANIRNTRSIYAVWIAGNRVK